MQFSRSIKINLIIIYSLIIPFISCGPSGKVLSSEAYQGKGKVGDVYLAVIGGEETKQCFDYLENFLKDSLIARGLASESKYYCCRDKNTDVNAVLHEMVPSDLNRDHLLSVVIAKEVVGYGASSSREVLITLFNLRQNKMEWSGNVRVDFSWFISDKNYQQVAAKINKLILEELTKKEII
jgi:hypothetical protein